MADACPVACNRCDSDSDTSVEVTVLLVAGEYRLKPVVAASPPGGGGLPSITISAVDGAGVPLVPLTASGPGLDLSPVLSFSLDGPRTRTQHVAISRPWR